MTVDDSLAIARRNSTIGLCLTVFLVSYHISVVPAIMPPLVRSLDSSVGYVQGALVLLSLVTASFAPTSENLSRRWGRKTVFHSGLILFAIGTLLVILSPEMGWFFVSYSLITGIAATPLVSIPAALIDNLYDNKAERLAFLALTLATVMGGLVGSLLGGFLAFRYGWRSAFPIELVLVAVVFYLVRIYPPKRHPNVQPIDWVGGLFSFLGLGLMLLGISLAGEFGWWEAKRPLYFFGVSLAPFGISIVPVLITAGSVCLGLFLFWERQQARDRKASLLSAGLLTRREFVAGLTVATVHSALTTGLTFNLFQFVPPVLELNSFQTALTILPYNIATVVVLVAMVKFLNVRIPPISLVQVGLSIEIVGLILLFFLIHPGMGRFQILVPLTIVGMGAGLFLSQISSITYAAASQRERPEATGIYNPFQKVGQALGRGILGTVLVAVASIKIVDGVIAQLETSVDRTLRSQAIDTLQRSIQTLTKTEMRILLDRLPASVQPYLETIINTAATHALKMTLLLILGLTLGCLLLTYQLPKRFAQLTDTRAYEPD